VVPLFTLTVHLSRRTNYRRFVRKLFLSNANTNKRRAVSLRQQQPSIRTVCGNIGTVLSLLHSDCPIMVHYCGPMPSKWLKHLRSMQSSRYPVLVTRLARRLNDAMVMTTTMMMMMIFPRRIIIRLLDRLLVALLCLYIVNKTCWCRCHVMMQTCNTVS